jgi:hypothetical protein
MDRSILYISYMSLQISKKNLFIVTSKNTLKIQYCNYKDKRSRGYSIKIDR